MTKQEHKKEKRKYRPSKWVNAVFFISVAIIALLPPNPLAFSFLLCFVFLSLVFDRVKNDPKFSEVKS